MIRLWIAPLSSYKIYFGELPVRLFKKLAKPFFIPSPFMCHSWPILSSEYRVENPVVPSSFREFFGVDIPFQKPVKVRNVKFESTIFSKDSDDLKHNLLYFMNSKMLENAEHEDAIKDVVTKRKVKSITADINKVTVVRMNKPLKMNIPRLRIPAAADLKTWHVTRIPAPSQGS